MKVTVCFNDIHVVVPCGDGELLVRELIDEAVSRYKKASPKRLSHSVFVHKLKTADGAILCSEDKTKDVIDNKDQLIAVFEVCDDNNCRPTDDNMTVMTSSSVSGLNTTAVSKRSPSSLRVRNDRQEKLIGEPDVDHNDNSVQRPTNQIAREVNNQVSSLVISSSGCKNLPDVTEGCTSNTSNDYRMDLLVNNDDTDLCVAAHLDDSKDSQTLKDVRGIPDKQHEGIFERKLPLGRESGSGSTGKGAFKRDYLRKSIGNSLATVGWLDAQERVQDRLQKKIFSSDDPDLESSNQLVESDSYLHYRTWSPSSSRSTYPLPPPLPLSPIPLPPPRKSSKKRPASSQTPQSCCAETFDPSLTQTPQPSLPVTATVVSKFEDCTKVKQAGGTSTSTPEKIISKSSTAESKAVVILPEVLVKESKIPLHSICAPSIVYSASRNVTSAVQSPTSLKSTVLAPTNTRLLGNKISIALIKGAHGLGFSITTRDNLTGDDCPIYIKNILPVGAAVEDGRLKAGDRLLMVNGIEVTGKSQPEVVKILRDVSAGSSVTIIVSRQSTADDHRITSADVSKLSTSSSDTQSSSSFKTETIRPMDLSVDSSLATSINSLSVGSVEHKYNCDNSALGVQKSTDYFANEEVRAADNCKTMCQEKEEESSQRWRDVVENMSFRAKGSWQGMKDAAAAGVYSIDHADVAENSDEILSFTIPLHQPGVSALGFTVRKVSERGKDIGISIKSVSVSGAMSKDDHIQINDRLLDIDGISLRGLNNSQAIDILKKAMATDGKVPGFISVTVARPRLGIVSRSATATPDCWQTENITTLETIQSDLNKGKEHRRSSRKVTTDADAKKAEMAINAGDKSTDKNLARGDTRRAELKSNSTNNSQNNNTEWVASQQEAKLLVDKSGTHDVADHSLSVVSTGEPIRLVGSPVRDALHSVTIDENELLSTPAFCREGYGRQSMSEKRKGYADPRATEFYQKMKIGKEKSQFCSASWDTRKSTFSKLAATKPDDLRRMIALRQKCKSLESLSTLPPLTFDVIPELPQRSPSPVEEVDDNPPPPLHTVSSVPIMASFENHLTTETTASPVPRQGRPRICGGNESFRAAIEGSLENVSSPEIYMETVEEDGEVDSVSHSSIPISGQSTTLIDIKRVFSANDIEPSSGRARLALSAQTNKTKALHEPEKSSISKTISAMFRFMRPKKVGTEKKVLRTNSNPSECHVEHFSARSSPARGDQRTTSPKSAKHGITDVFRFAERLRTKDGWPKPEEESVILTDVFPVKQSNASSPVTRHRDIKTKSADAEKMEKLRVEYRKQHFERHGHYPYDDSEEVIERQICEYEMQAAIKNEPAVIAKEVAELKAAQRRSYDKRPVKSIRSNDPKYTKPNRLNRDVGGTSSGLLPIQPSKQTMSLRPAPRKQIDTHSLRVRADFIRTISNGSSSSGNRLVDTGEPATVWYGGDDSHKYSTMGEDRTGSSTVWYAGGVSPQLVESNDRVNSSPPPDSANGNSLNSRSFASPPLQQENRSAQYANSDKRNLPNELQSPQVNTVKLGRSPSTGHFRQSSLPVAGSVVMRK